MNEGLSIVTKVPLWWEMLIMGEAMPHVWGQWHMVYVANLYLLNFAVNLRLL